MSHQLSYYLNRYLDGSITADEWQLFQELLNNPENQPSLDRLVDEQIISASTNTIHYEGVNETLKKEIFSKISTEKIAQSTKTASQVHMIPKVWLRYAAALVLFLGAAAYVWMNGNNKTSSPGHTAIVPEIVDVQPGHSRATLTLSNGKTLSLSSDTTEAINDGKLLITNADGQLHYNPSEVVAANTMTTPRGGQYQLILADGTKVWLNAASSITYPTSFPGKTREVFISGEAYVEVKPNKHQPFIVNTKFDQITVLGTSFNINAYDDEDGMKTSLIEGSINVNDIIIRPGHAFFKGKVMATNISQDIAWKNGVFNFEDINGEQAMRQLARWYDVDFKIVKDIKDIRFGGALDRSLTLNQILKGLEGMDGLHFTIDGNTVLVTR